jgi:CheY-like chemotaxis protein
MLKRVLIVDDSILMRRMIADSLSGALNQTKLISEAIRAGAQDFIAKPFMPEQLQETLHHAVEEPAVA